MDYAFAPGRKKNEYAQKMRQLLTNRPQTTLIDKKKIRTVKQFREHLESSTLVPKPIGNLIISSHGSDSGWLQIKLDNLSPTILNYESLKEVKDRDTIKIPNTLVENSEGEKAPLIIHIKGCKIGAPDALPFMELLKIAFGANASAVTAPMHFHATKPNAPPGAAFEFLSYSFSIFQKNELTTKSAVVFALQKSAFSFISVGSSPPQLVPDGLWNALIPENVKALKKTPKREYFRLGETAGGQTKIKITREFRHKTRQYSITLNGPANAIPERTAERMSILTDAISNHPTFQSGYGYPIYKRYKYTNTTDFIEGLEWTFTPNQKKGKLKCVGTRHEYTVVLPITDPASDSTPFPSDSAEEKEWRKWYLKKNLIFNFFPKKGSSDPTVINLLETDNRLFGTV